MTTREILGLSKEQAQDLILKIAELVKSGGSLPEFFLEVRSLLKEPPVVDDIPEG